jgi:hypothetical protein
MSLWGVIPLLMNELGVDWYSTTVFGVVSLENPFYIPNNHTFQKMTQIVLKSITTDILVHPARDSISIVPF